MTSDPTLERYLSSLEHALKPFPVGDRAEIITEIRSHVFSALERDPQTSMDTVLSALGEPETVANRYLMERGLKPTKPPISPIVKWLVIGFLGTTAMVLAFAGFVMTSFMPLLSVDEKAGTVTILGGLIHVDEADGDFSFAGAGRFKTSGSVPMTGRPLVAHFGSGKIEMETSPNDELTWECQSGKEATVEPKLEPQAVELDLKALGSARCEIQVPEGVKVAIDGSSGKLEVEGPKFDLDAKLTSGLIEFNPAEGTNYRYEVSATSGHVDEFLSSDAADARQIKLQVTSGKIARGETEKKDD